MSSAYIHEHETWFESFFRLGSWCTSRAGAPPVPECIDIAVREDDVAVLFHRDQWQLLSPRLVKSLLSEQRADRDDHANYARPLAKLIMCHPELAARLQPDKGQFHRKIITCIQIHPKLTPELRARLAEHQHILPYLI